MKSIYLNTDIDTTNVASTTFKPAKSIRVTRTAFVQKPNYEISTELHSLELKSQTDADMLDSRKNTNFYVILTANVLRLSNALPWPIIKPASFFMSGILLMLMWFHG